MLQSILLILFTILHPFYVSVTEINHNKNAHTLEISSRIFLGDLEHALEKEYNQKVNILKPVDKKKVEQMIAGYVGKHLILSVNGKPVSMNYVGYEIEDDGAWCYFEVPNVTKVEQMVIRNDILFKYFPDQTNMIHASAQGNRKSIKLNNPDSEVSFKFN